MTNTHHLEPCDPLDLAYRFLQRYECDLGSAAVLEVISHWIRQGELEKAQEALASPRTELLADSKFRFYELAEAFAARGDLDNALEAAFKSGSFKSAFQAMAARGLDQGRLIEAALQAEDQVLLCLAGLGNELHRMLSLIAEGDRRLRSREAELLANLLGALAEVSIPGPKKSTPDTILALGDLAKCVNFGDPILARDILDTALRQTEDHLSRSEDVGYGQVYDCQESLIEGYLALGDEEKALALVAHWEPEGGHLLFSVLTHLGAHARFSEGLAIIERFQLSSQSMNILIPEHDPELALSWIKTLTDRPKIQRELFSCLLSRLHRLGRTDRLLQRLDPEILKGDFSTSSLLLQMGELDLALNLMEGSETPEAIGLRLAVQLHQGVEYDEAQAVLQHLKDENLPETLYLAWRSLGDLDRTENPIRETLKSKLKELCKDEPLPGGLALAQFSEPPREPCFEEVLSILADTSQAPPSIFKKLLELHYLRNGLNDVQCSLAQSVLFSLEDHWLKGPKRHDSVSWERDIP